MISNDNNGVKTISSESGILDLTAFSTFTSTHTPITAASTPPLPALKMASSDDNQKASYDRKIKTTIIAGVSALVTTQFVSWILGYFK